MGEHSRQTDCFGELPDRICAAYAGWVLLEYYYRLDKYDALFMNKSS
jgi:hypothetical protein